MCHHLDGTFPIFSPPRPSENPDFQAFEAIFGTKKSGSSDLFFNPLPDLEN